MGIDTWAVDYVLLDGENRILGNTYGYRDGRTKGMDKEVYRIIPEDACMPEPVSRSRFSIRFIS